MIIRELRILPPLAIGRLGSSPEPVTAITAGVALMLLDVLGVGRAPKTI